MNYEQFKLKVENKIAGKDINFIEGAFVSMIHSLEEYSKCYKPKKTNNKSAKILQEKNKNFLENCDFIIPGMLVKVKSNARTPLRFIESVSSYNFVGRHVKFVKEKNHETGKYELVLSMDNYITSHFKDKIVGFYCDLYDVPMPNSTDFSNYRTVTFIRENIGPYYDIG